MGSIGHDDCESDGTQAQKSEALALRDVDLSTLLFDLDLERHGFGWKRWSNPWLYGSLGLFYGLPGRPLPVARQNCDQKSFAASLLLYRRIMRRSSARPAAAARYEVHLPSCGWPSGGPRVALPGHLVEPMSVRMKRGSALDLGETTMWMVLAVAGLTAACSAVFLMLSVYYR